MIRKVMGVCLSLIILYNFIFSTYAEENIVDNKQIIYVDDVEFTAWINDDYEVEIEGANDISTGYMRVGLDGESEVVIIEYNIEDFGDKTEIMSIDDHYTDISDISEDISDVSIKKFSLEIDTLTEEEINLSIYDDSGLVEKFDEIDKFEDHSNDMSGRQEVVTITAGGVAISLSMLLEVLMSFGLAVMIGSVLYIMASILYNEVTAASKKKRAKFQKFYFKAYEYKGFIYVHPKGISLTKAIKHVKNNQSIYTILKKMAKKPITGAGYTAIGPEIDEHQIKGHIYFYHFHKGNSNGKRISQGKFHSFYGRPYVVK